MHSRYRSRAGPRVLSIFTKLRYRAGSTGLGPRRRICSDQWFRGWSRAMVPWLIRAADDLSTCAVTGTVTTEFCIMFCTFHLCTNNICVLHIFQCSFAQYCVKVCTINIVCKTCYLHGFVMCIAHYCSHCSSTG